MKNIIRKVGIIVLLVLIGFSMTSCSYEVECEWCNGSGVCSSCNGEGYKTDMSKLVKCTSCNGSGVCSSCNGTGKRTKNDFDRPW